jgi:hypothetical protein
MWGIFKEFAGFHPAPHELLKKLDQNFNLKSCIRTILGFNARVFAPLFSKSGWGLGRSPKVD